ncbi:MAG: nucleoside triphosphate pyrophosphohydrolase [Alphaproteobacteria bacterium]|nr:nucleoside triphosphate pyrophosphohydrolase [Alphaproteobacteria bacterium]
MTRSRSDQPALPAQGIERLCAIMARLRSPEGGCPWDLEQNFRTIAPYTIEEAYEVADAIERNDLPALKDELGDLLLQVVFHARMAEEAGAFRFDDVVAAISDKMLRRHPHVFGDANVADAKAQTQAWEAQKASERAANAAAAGRHPSALDGVSTAYPALMRAVKLQKRAARVGFDWPEVAQVFDKIEEEIIEIKDELAGGGEPSAARVADEIGDLLFACANLSRHLKIDPEDALRQGNIKFEKRFRQVEALLAERGRSAEDSNLEEMEELWQQAKRQLGSTASA